MQFKVAIMVCGVMALIVFGGCDSNNKDKPCEDGGTVCPGGELCAEKACFPVCDNSSSCEDSEACVESLCREYEAACSADEPCAGGWFCNDNSKCERLSRIGAECVDGSSCELGFCVDGLCCADACEGACLGCNNAQTGTNNGMCAPILVGTDPGDECDGILACDGNGQCFGKANDQACENDFECLSGRCIESLCREGLCGDGHVDTNEACDDSNTMNGDYCSADCQTVIGACGDTVLQSNEACEDGNVDDGDYCSADCLTVTGWCGDSTVQSIEECDDGDTEDTGNGCAGDCTQNNTCGDGELESVFEDCDDGDAVDSNNGCSADCLANNVCGDSIIQTLVEDCDDGDTDDTGNGCSTECADNSVCGNGNVESLFEGCDDNEAGDQGNGCSDACQRNDDCGNSTVEALYEDCDDGDAIDAGNGCSGQCQQNNTCGDGDIESLFESCDDGGQSVEDGCSDSCGIEPGWGCLGEPSTCARVIRVDRNSTHSSPTGFAWESALPNLQDAIDQAVSGDQIWVATGKYYPTSGSGREKTFVLKDGVALYGGFAGTESHLSERDWITNETVLNGNIDHATDPLDTTPNNNAYHVVTGVGLGGTTAIDGFTIEWGEAALDIGGDTKNGAGLWLKDSGPTIANTVFRANEAKSTQAAGGAIYLNHSNPTIVNSTFYGNLSNASGGAIFADFGSHFTISLSTFVDNTAFVSGGIFYLIGSSTVAVSNSILWDSSPSHYSGSGITITDCSIEDAAADGTVNITWADPKFVDAPGRDFRLDGTTAFTNWGDNSKIPVDSTDMDGDGNRSELVPLDGYGQLRIVGNTVDFGAFEIQ